MRLRSSHQDQSSTISSTLWSVERNDIPPSAGRNEIPSAVLYEVSGEMNLCSSSNTKLLHSKPRIQTTSTTLWSVGWNELFFFKDQILAFQDQNTTTSNTLWSVGRNDIPPESAGRYEITSGVLYEVPGEMKFFASQSVNHSVLNFLLFDKLWQNTWDATFHWIILWKSFKVGAVVFQFIQ